MIRIITPGESFLQKEKVPQKISQIDLQWFAPEDEGKTEDPTEHRLKKLREEGRLPKSQDLAGSFILLVISLMLVAIGPFIENRFESVMQYCIQNASYADLNGQRYIYLFLSTFVISCLPFLAVGLIIGIVVNVFQNKGFLFTPGKIKPDFNRLNIIKGFGEYFKNIFSRKGFFKLGTTLGKVILIVVVIVVVLMIRYKNLLLLLQAGNIKVAVKQVSRIVVMVLIICSVIFCIISIVDFIMQQRFFLRDNKMSVQEVKQEYKEMEGDPQIKAQLMQMQQQLLTKNVMQAVQESDVVVTNPTHFAVALKYDTEISDAPVVNAKGEDLTAQRIKQIAFDNDIPVVENKPLARDIYTNSEIGDIIPDEYIKAVALIYAQVGYVNKHKKN